jgi:adenylate cyclase
MAIPIFRPNVLRPWLSRHVPLAMIGIGIALAVIGLQETGVFQGIELALLDREFRLRPLENKTVPIVIVTISEADLVGLNQFPISDQTLSRVIERLKQENPTVIGLNLYRDLPVEPGYEDLLQTFRSTPNLIGVKKYVKDSAGRGVRPPPILRDRDQVAFNDLVGDIDGKIRRHLLSVQTNGQTELSLGTQLALTYLKTSGITPQRNAKGELQLGRATYSALSRNAGGYAQMKLDGFQLLSNYLKITDGIAKISIQDVLNGRIPPGLLRDRIVVIGSTSESSRGDRFLVPYTTDVHTVWFGAEIHANLAAQLISGALDGRTMLQCLPEALEWAWILLWAGVGTLLGWGIQSLRSLIWIPLAIGILWMTAHGLFLGGWWILIVSPFMAFLAAGLTSRGYWVWYTLKQVNQSLELKVLERTQELQRQNLDLEQAKLAADTANQAKSLFLASMNHELRTPLTSILGFSELLKRSKNITEIEKEDLEIINRSGNHLLDLINNVLDLSKIEAAAMTIELETTDLGALLETVEQMIQVNAIEKQLTFVAHYDPNLPAFVQLDQRKLRQILINLLSNAVKFTRKGSIRLDVCLDVCLDARSQEPQLSFQVTDTGPGISLDELPQVFQPFFQTETGRQSQKGTGLGLAISQQFAEIMGGDLSVQSTLGEGSIFTLKLPFTLHEGPIALDPKPETTWRLAPDQPDYRILVVDDEAPISRFLVQLLSQVGFDVRSTTDGTAGLAEWQTWQPHLLLLDLQMPDLDGHAIAQHIRQVEQSIELDAMTPSIKTRDTILIAITANTEIYLPTIFASGFDDMVSKPFREQTILTKIGQHLEVRFASLQ